MIKTLFKTAFMLFSIVSCSENSDLEIDKWNSTDLKEETYMTKDGTIYKYLKKPTIFGSYITIASTSPKTFTLVIDQKDALIAKNCGLKPGKYIAEKVILRISHIEPPYKGTEVLAVEPVPDSELDVQGLDDPNVYGWYPEFLRNNGYWTTQTKFGFRVWLQDCHAVREWNETYHRWDIGQHVICETAAARIISDENGKKYPSWTTYPVPKDECAFNYKLYYGDNVAVGI